MDYVSTLVTLRDPIMQFVCLDNPIKKKTSYGFCLTEVVDVQVKSDCCHIPTANIG